MTPAFTGLRVAPTLETPRLLLRAHAPADFDASFAMWADPDVVRYIGGRPAAQEDAWSRLLRYAGHWSLLGYGFWAVIHKLTGRFVGEVGVGDFRRFFDTPVPELTDGAPEAGWAFATHAHGRGFATEAVQAALAWSDTHLAPPVTLCIVHPDNAGSLHVARKCGFIDGGEVTYRGEPTRLLRRFLPPATT